MKKILLIILASLLLLNAETLFEIKDASDNPVFSISDDGMRVINNGDTMMVITAAEAKINLDNSKNKALSRSFIIVTDGYISIEKQVFDLIRNNCDNANVFSFGIGSGVNRHLIEGMAHVGQGEPLIVLNENEANIEAEKFRQYINKPVLTQVKKSFSGL